VVLADGRCRFVQVVFPDICNGAVELGDFAFLLFPITTEFNFAA
jgi:hypothetical protein